MSSELYVEKTKKSRCKEIVILLFQAYVKTLRAPEDASEFLASLTNSWSVDNWEQFLHIINEKFVEQPLIPFLLTKGNWMILSTSLFQRQTTPQNSKTSPQVI